MTAPVNPPTLFPPFAATAGDTGFWPPSPIERKRSNDLQNFEPGSNAEFPPIKKPRNSEDGASNTIQNLPFNPRIPLPNPLNNNNKGMGRLFFKTKICTRFNLGICPYGSSCNFAHGPDDIRRPPPNWQDIVAAHDDDRMVRNWGDQQRMISKYKICKKFYNGEECPYGERCLFVHESPEMYRESVAISIGTTAGTGSNEGATNRLESNGVLICGGDGNSSNLKPVFWKTRICNKWETTGHCPFGEKCHFAHGLAELKKFGEAENACAGMAPSKALFNPAKNISPSKTAASCKQQVQGKKCFAKWKGPDKISRIYADWIDDMPLVHRSPSKVES